jgi:2-dehydro-3-deoxy-D-arabinonate dehydratase
MKLCRFHLPQRGARLGLVTNGQVFDLTASGEAHFASLTALLQASMGEPIPALLHTVELDTLPSLVYAELDRTPDGGIAHLLPPVDRQEVWAAGVTYAWSREARVREAKTKGVYVRVYEADRPELFFKALAEKVVGPNNWIGLRGDSQWNVPEPELALVLNPQARIVGLTVGNDVSSRDIEGENPLYLPQAKIFRHSCALGPVIALADQPFDSRGLAVHLTISRANQIVFKGNTSTGHMNRSLEDLAAYLSRYNDFPYGVCLLTGTGIVPGDDFTLQDGDDVTIEIDSLGVLHNVVRQM